MIDKKTQILKAALRMVTAYGFKRTSMEDIAQEAGVSRPAIYLLFRNKDDVFTSCIDMLLEEAFGVAEAAMLDASSPKAKASAYLSAYMEFYHKLLVAGPHGQEMMDVNNRLGAEKTIAAEARFVLELNRMLGLKDDAETGQILMMAAGGIKFQTKDAATLRARLAILVDKLVD